MSDIKMTVPMVINTNFGGYSLSREASEEVARRKRLKTRMEDGRAYIGNGYDTICATVPRNDPDLVVISKSWTFRSVSKSRVSTATSRCA